jgi:3,4-dihydroxy-9,10-secoandrosta-1,3,5(10)-triene-9,17-dione 4,5-dioxygenase
MVSFYMQGPAGFDVEIGWDGVLVGEDWVENEFAGTGDEWGHHGLDADALKPRD